jgi:hypothetical protein
MTGSTIVMRSVRASNLYDLYAFVNVLRVSPLLQTSEFSYIPSADHFSLVASETRLASTSIKAEQAIKFGHFNNDCQIYTLSHACLELSYIPQHAVAKQYVNSDGGCSSKIKTGRRTETRRQYSLQASLPEAARWKDRATLSECPFACIDLSQAFTG